MLKFRFVECQKQLPKIHFVQRYKDLVKTKARVEKLISVTYKATAKKDFNFLT